MRWNSEGKAEHDENDGLMGDYQLQWTESPSGVGNYALWCPQERALEEGPGRKERLLRGEAKKDDARNLGFGITSIGKVRGSPRGKRKKQMKATKKFSGTAIGQQIAGQRRAKG